MIHLYAMLSRFNVQLYKTYSIVVNLVAMSDQIKGTKCRKKLSINWWWKLQIFLRNCSHYFPNYALFIQPRYEKQVQQEEEAYQQQRRRLLSEIQEEKDRIAQQASRQRSDIDKLQQQLQDKHSYALDAMKNEFEKAREEQENRHAVSCLCYKIFTLILLRDSSTEDPRP